MKKRIYLKWKPKRIVVSDGGYNYTAVVHFTRTQAAMANICYSIVMLNAALLESEGSMESHENICGGIYDLIETIQFHSIEYNKSCFYKDLCIYCGLIEMHINKNELVPEFVLDGLQNLLNTTGKSYIDACNHYLKFVMEG